MKAGSAALTNSGTRMKNRLSSLLLTFALTACSSTALPTATTVAGAPQAVHSAGGSVAVAYLNDPDFGGPYGLYFYGSTGTTPTQTVSNLWVDAMTTDASGNLYTADSGGEIKVYSRGQLVRSLRGAQGPSDVAVDSSRNVYVANEGFSNTRGFVEVYGPDATTPSARITSGIDTPARVATDHAGNLYVLNRTLGKFVHETIAEYPPHTTKPSRTLRIWLDSLATMAVDPQTGTIYVAANRGRTIDVYGTSGTKPVRTITDGVGYAFALAVDGNGRLYVEGSPGAYGETFSIRIFAPGGSSPIQIIRVGGSAQCSGGASAISVDAADDVYVLSCVSPDIHKWATAREYAPSGKLVRTFSNARIAVGVATLS